MAVDGGRGVLFLVKNYTGDVLNFETAAEMAAAEGIKVQSILIDDDVAVKDSLYTAGRRGVGTTVLAEKVWSRRRGWPYAGVLRRSLPARSICMAAPWAWRLPLARSRPRQTHVCAGRR